MSATTDALRELRSRPDLWVIKDQLIELAADEGTRRQAWFDALVDGDRDEWINGEPVMASPVRHKHTTVKQAIRDPLKQHVQTNGLGFVDDDSLHTQRLSPGYCILANGNLKGVRR